MPPLKAARRKRLPASAFVYPPSSPVGGKGRGLYPIDTKARARNALARAAQSGTAGSYPTVARAVRRKWGNAIPTVGPKKGVVSRPGTRKTRRSSSR